MYDNIPHKFHLGEILGYRVWRLERNKLRALTTEYVWKRGANGPATEIATTGGFYALTWLTTGLMCVIVALSVVLAFKI